MTDDDQQPSIDRSTTYAQHSAAAPTHNPATCPWCRMEQRPRENRPTHHLDDRTDQ